MTTTAAYAAPTERSVGIDVNDLSKHARGPSILNALMSSSGEMFRTKSGRLAVVLRAETFEKLKGQLNLVTTESVDGLLTLMLERP